MVVPKLRFKEFESTVEVRKLGNISNIVVGFVGTVSDQYCDQNEGIPFVRTQNVRDGYFSVENLEYVTRDFHKKNKKSQIFNGDVLIARVGANMGMVCAVENLDTEANCANVIIIKNNLQLNSQYLSLFLNSENGQKQIHSGGAGGAQAVFNTTLAKEISFPYFPLQEQTKIASFLSAVDEKISQLTQKHELLSQYKQGMMQKLFSQQLRFKADDGSEFGEWEEVRLGNLVDLTSGFAFKSDFFSEDGNKLITPKNFTTTGKANFTDTNTKWTTEISDKKYICRPNDLLVLLTDLTQSCELLGKPILLSQDDGNVLLNQRIVKIIPNRKLEKPFLLYLLLTDDFHELIVSTASGTTVKHSSNKVLQSFHFYLPCLEEQTKIANFLSAIDQKIEVVAHQIEQAKQWKKGLLQQMFV